MVSDEEREREQRLRDLQMVRVQEMADLGTQRREFLFTVDRRSEFDRVSKYQLEATRAANVRGTAAHRLAAENRDRLSAWANAYATVEQEETEDIQNFKDGQSHRARLNQRMEQDDGPDPWEEGRRNGIGARGGRSSGRGRGGGIVGSRGRSGFDPVLAAAGPSSSPVQHGYPLRSTQALVPITAPAPTHGGSGGALRAIIRPLPNMAMGNRRVKPAQAPQPSSRFQSTTVSESISKSKGGEVASSTTFGSNLDKALKLAKEIAEGKAKPGVAPSHGIGQSIHAPARENIQASIDRRPQPHVPRAPAVTQRYNSTVASPEDFMAAAKQRMAPNPLKTGPVMASAAPGAQITNLRSGAGQASSSAETSESRFSDNSSSQRNIAALPLGQPSRNLKSVNTQLGASIHAPPSAAEFKTTEEAVLGSSFTQASSPVGLQEQRARQVPQARLPQPVVKFSARSQSSAISQGTGSEIPQVPSSARQSFLELHDLSEQDFEEVKNRVSFDEDDNLINFDDDEVESSVRSQHAAAWTQPDQGILDLDNEQITSEPLQPWSASAEPARVDDDSARQEALNLKDGSVDLNEEEDIETLFSSVLALNLGVQSNPDLLKLQNQVQKHLNRLAREKNIAKKSEPDKLDILRSAGDLLIDRQRPPPASPTLPAPSYGERGAAALGIAVSCLRGVTNVLEDATEARTHVHHAPATDFNFAQAPEPTSAFHAAESQAQGPTSSRLHKVARAGTQGYGRPTVEPNLTDADQPNVDEYVQAQQNTRPAFEGQKQRPSKPDLRPQAPSFQPSVTPSSSIPCPLPPGRSLHYKHNFPFLSEEERSYVLQEGAIPNTSRDDGSTHERVSQDRAAEQPKRPLGPPTSRPKPSIVFDSGLKLHDGPIVGEHLLPGRGEGRRVIRNRIPEPVGYSFTPTLTRTHRYAGTPAAASLSTSIFSERMLPSPNQPPVNAGVLAPARSSNSVFGERMPSGHNKATAKSSSKSEALAAEGSSASASVFGDRLLPGRLIATSKVTVDHLDTPLSDPPIFGARMLPGQSLRAHRPPNVFADSPLVEAKVASRSSSETEIDPRRKGKAKLQHVCDEVDGMKLDKPLAMDFDTQAEKVKYSAEKLLEMQNKTTSSQFNASTFKYHPTMREDIRRAVSSHMEKTHLSMLNAQTPAKVQQTSSQVPITSPKAPAIPPTLPKVPPRLPEAGQAAESHSSGQAQSSSTSASAAPSQTFAAKGAVGRYAMLQSIYAKPAPEDQNHGPARNPIPQQPQPQPSHLTPQAANVDLQTSDNARSNPSRFSTANPTPKPFAPISENPFANSAQPRISSSAQNPFASASQPRGQSLLFSDFQAQSTNSKALSPRATNTSSRVYRREDSGYDADREINDNKRSVDRVNKPNKAGQDLLSSRWATDDNDPSQPMLRQRRTCQTDGFLGRR